MINLLIIVIFFACWILYNTSKKAVLNTETVLEKWVHSNHKKAKIIGLITIFITSIFSIYNLGYTSGILFWFVAIMILFSLIIIISPLKIISYKHLLLVFIISTTLELIL